jgi:hypothetical protein
LTGVLGVFTAPIIRLMTLVMKAVNTPETSIGFYPTTLCNIPEDSRLFTSRRENLKSHDYILNTQRYFLK